MDKSQQNNDKKTPSGTRNIRHSVQRTGISKIINRLHSRKTIVVVSGLNQMLLGLTIITVSLMGFIQPLWLLIFLTVSSSFSTMFGFFLVYQTFSKMHDPNELLRTAMKRVMESKN